MIIMLYCIYHRLYFVYLNLDKNLMGKERRKTIYKLYDKKT